ncbi:MAG: O-antigen ligase family protein [Clostridia bacterium]|nr:O-antigen ligase family protein [Clostridia bacterium]
MKKKLSFAELMRNSFIIGWLITLADRLYEAIPKSATAKFFSDYNWFFEKWKESFIGGFLSRFSISRMKILGWKNRFSHLVENSVLYSNAVLLKEKLLTARLRVYGAACLGYGLLSGIYCLIRIFLLKNSPGIVYLALSMLFLLLGIVWIWSKKPSGQALYDSLFVGTVLSGFVGIRRDEMVYNSVNDRGITLGFVCGLLLGICSAVVSPLYIFGAAAAVILLLILGSKPEFGLIFITLTLPFIPTMVMCGLTLYCFGAYILKVARGKRSLKFEAVDFAVILFMIFIFLGGIVSVTPTESTKSAAVFIALMLNYLLTANLIRSNALMNRFMNSLVFSMFITTIIGLYQKFFMTANTTWHDTTMFEDIGTRIYSTFQNPNVYGEYLVMSIPVAVALLFTCTGQGKRYPVFIACVSALLALVYTQSRGAWLAFIISMAIYLMVKTSRILVVYLLGIFSIPLLPAILPESIVSRFTSIGNLADSSTSYRVSIWEAAVKMIGDFFAGGIGIGTSAFSKVYPSYSLAGIEAAPHSHQLFFQIAIEMGVFALICFLVIIFMAVRKNSHALICHGTGNEYTLISSAALCGIIGMLVQGMTDYVWYNYRVFGMFWIILGLCVAAIRCADSQGTKK